MKAELDRRVSFTDRVEQYFRERPQQWVSAYDLERVGGRHAWRTRVSEARQRFEADGWTITNKQLRHEDAVISMYRLTQKPLGRDASEPGTQRTLFG